MGFYFLISTKNNPACSEIVFCFFLPEIKPKDNYLTESFRFLLALNFGTFMAGTLMASPVLGFRACLAALSLTEKFPTRR